MRFETRWAEVTVLSVTVLVACGDKHGLSEARPDSGTPDLVDANRDGAAPLDGGDDLGSDATVRPPGSASFTASPPSVDFGTIDMGVASAPVLVTVSNTGSAASGPLTVVATGTGISAVGCSITGVNKDDFRATTTCNKPLVPSETNTCQIEVVYDPKAATVTNATATLTVTLPNGASASAALVGTAVTGGVPSITGGDTGFGNVVVGSSSAAHTFTMTNNGSETMKITRVSTTLPEFVIATDNCTGKGMPAKAWCTFTVQFQPVPGDLGAMNGQLKVDFEYPPYPAYLAVIGTAVPSAAVLPPWDQARLGNTGTGWWMNAQKGKFFLSIRLENSYPEDTTGRAQAVSIGKLVASRTGSTAKDLVPLPKELPGTWVYDPDTSPTEKGPVVATTYEEATGYIDGGAAPFYTSAYSAKVLAWANYSESRGDMSYGLDLRVWEMASAEDAAALYKDLLKNSLYSPDLVPWKTCQSSETDPCP